MMGFHGFRAGTLTANNVLYSNDGSGGGSFTSAWKSLQVSGGGLLTGIKAYLDGTVVARGDSYGSYIRISSGTVVQDGTTWIAPAWKHLITTDSLPSGDVTDTLAYSLNTGAVETVAAPNNTNVIYVWWNNIIWVSSDRGISFVRLMGGLSGGIVDFNPNGGHANNAWMAVDPNNPDVIYLCTPSNGVYINTAGTSGGTWSKITSIANTSGNGGNIVFDQTSIFTGGRTQGIHVFIDGVLGHYQSTNGSTFALVTSGSPPTNAMDAICDKFGQIWCVEGFSGTAGAVYKFTGGTWTRYLAATGSNNQITAILQDPNSISAATNQMIAVTWQGWLWVSTNGTTWTQISETNTTLSSVSPQAGWLNDINQYFSHGNLQLNVIGATMHPSGEIFAATGIDVWITPVPIVSGIIQTTVPWSSDNIGIDQLVNNMIMSAPGASPLLSNWDRALILAKNPDKFVSKVYPDKNTSAINEIIVGGWGTDYARNKPATVIGILAGQSGGEYFAVSQNGGNDWSLLTVLPATSVGLGGVVAASTDQNWCVVPGDSSGQNTVVYYTLDGGMSWHLATFAGSPSAFIDFNTGHYNNRQPLCADSTVEGTFYIIDIDRNVFKTTNNGANWAATGATAAQFDSYVQQDRLLCPPKGVGTFNTSGHVFYAPQNGSLYKSTDNAVNFISVKTTLDRVICFGFGAPIPGGNGYPTIYAIQASGGSLAQGIYQSTDGGTVWLACQLPTSEQKYPYHLMDNPQWLSGDVNVYGRIYVGFKGSTATYIDTGDACPWVNLSNINPGDDKTGTITLSAEHSGLVPVTSVQFNVDGIDIGSSQTGSGPYSISWDTSSVAAGTHTLKVSAIGANGSGSFSIPFTTHQRQPPDALTSSSFGMVSTVLR